ncbi:MAG: hypothetical protein U9N35_08395 [Euryarchaeota archaeon]|nr:hypothetical protein [Euryarchaeota archaeon]
MRLFKCYLRIFNKTEKEVQEILSKAMKKIYDKPSIKGPPYFEVSVWNNTPEIEITGAGEDKRCALCDYVAQIVGKENIRRNNCPFYFNEPSKEDKKKREKTLDLIKKLGFSEDR